TATKGSYFAMPEGNGTNNSVPPPAKATFYFQLPADGSFIVWVRVKSPSIGHRGYFVNAGLPDWTLWQTDANPTWSWVKISDPSSGLPILFQFNEGFNTFIMGWQDDNVQIDRII